jgi:hypothetical protein
LFAVEEGNERECVPIGPCPKGKTNWGREVLRSIAADRERGDYQTEREERVSSGVYIKFFRQRMRVKDDARQSR